METVNYGRNRFYDTGLRGKHSNFLWKFVNYDGKKFYNYGPWTYGKGQ